MDVDNLNCRVVFEVLAKFGDINVHTTSIEVVVVDPNSFQSKITLKNLINVCAEKA